jgi:hypothetical protein
VTSAKATIPRASAVSTNEKPCRTSAREEGTSSFMGGGVNPIGHGSAWQRL